jgi:hypothetical protein
LRLYESLTAEKVELYGEWGTCICVKRLLLLATVLAVVLPGHASAAGTPCRNQVVNDWYRDGKIASSYPLGCYRDALKHIPADADIYSSLRDDVQAALRAATRRSEGLSAPNQVGHGPNATGAGDVKAALLSINKSPHDPVSAGASTIASSGPVASTSSGTPVPILILGGLALALVAAGAVGAGLRHARGRNR